MASTYASHLSNTPALNNRRHTAHHPYQQQQQQWGQQQQLRQQRRRRVALAPLSAASASASASASQQKATTTATPHPQELRVCTGKVCSRQGSRQIASLGAQLGLPQVTVTTGGCLGACGSGPNAALLPAGEVLRHIATPADLAQVLRAFCGVNIDGPLLRATELRIAGNALALAGDLQGAIAKYNEALAAGDDAGGDGGNSSSGGSGSGAAYMVFSNLSAAYLELKDISAAVSAAREAVARAPAGFHKAHVRLIDALYAAGEVAEAEEALAAAIAADGGFAALPEYKVIRRALDGAAAAGPRRGGRLK